MTGEVASRSLVGVSTLPASELVSAATHLLGAACALLALAVYVAHHGSFIHRWAGRDLPPVVWAVAEPA